MNLKNKKIGFALTGSFSGFNKAIDEVQKLIKNNNEIFPIMSYSSYNFNTRYEKASDIRNKLKIITNKKIIHTIPKAEQIGNIIDILVILPCSRKHYI